MFLNTAASRVKVKWKQFWYVHRQFIKLQLSLVLLHYANRSLFIGADSSFRSWVVLRIIPVNSIIRRNCMGWVLKSTLASTSHKKNVQETDYSEIGHGNVDWKKVGFQSLMAVSMKMAVFWVVVPCSLVDADWYTRLHSATSQKTVILICHDENLKSFILIIVLICRERLWTTCNIFWCFGCLCVCVYTHKSSW